MQDIFFSRCSIIMLTCNIIMLAFGDIIISHVDISFKPRRWCCQLFQAFASRAEGWVCESWPRQTKSLKQVLTVVLLNVWQQIWVSRFLEDDHIYECIDGGRCRRCGTLDRILTMSRSPSKDQNLQPFMPVSIFDRDGKKTQTN